MYAHQMNAGTYLTLQACTADGTVYDITNIVPYVQKFKRHPVSGEPLQLKDVIKLNFYKNNDGEYHCPMLHKVGTLVLLNDQSGCWEWLCLRGASSLQISSACTCCLIAHCSQIACTVCASHLLHAVHAQRSPHAR